LTLPVEWVPSYDEIRIKSSSQSKASSRMRSAINTAAPDKTHTKTMFSTYDFDITFASIVVIELLSHGLHLLTDGVLTDEGLELKTFDIDGVVNHCFNL
jgi:hypothetical protein